jgi:hypothetical protein
LIHFAWIVAKDIEMKKLTLTFVLVAVLLSLSPNPSAFAQTTCMETAGPFGSLLNVAEFTAAVQALPPAAFFQPPVQPPLPSHAFLTNLPAVSQQGTSSDPGSPGSCEAQSFGYGLGSYTAARYPDGSSKWNPALPRNSVSPAYLFAWGIYSGFASCPPGGLALPYLNQLVAVGAPTRGEIPYEPDCTYFNTIQSQAAFPDGYLGMEDFQIGSYGAFQISSNPSAALELIKEYIANGQAVAFSGYVLCGYGTNVQLQDGVIYETSYSIKSNGQPSGHGQLVVGYDDDIGTPGNTGALLIQNSFGTSWPASAGAPSSPAPAGMVYWSYNSFEKTQQLAAVAYPRAPWPLGGVPLLRSSNAPLGSITRAFQWAPAGSPQAAYLILTHWFVGPIRLKSVTLTEPGANPVTATAIYGQYISTGYSYLTRTDGKAFLPGLWTVSLAGSDVAGDPVIYTGRVWVGGPQPQLLSGASMAGQTITGSTGAAATLSD